MKVKDSVNEQFPWEKVGVKESLVYSKFFWKKVGQTTCLFQTFCQEVVVKSIPTRIFLGEGWIEGLKYKFN